MKTKISIDYSQFNGTFIIPVIETNEKNLVPITFQEVSVSSKLFYGKKDTHYIAENNNSIYLFIGLGKTTDYASIKKITRRIASKQKSVLDHHVGFVVPQSFTADLVEAAVSGLYLGTYQLGHFKKNELHPFLNTNFELEIFSETNYNNAAEKGIKIAQAQIEVMNLVDLPPNVVTPEYLSKWATNTGNKYGFKTEIFNRAECEAHNLNAFIAVGKGSQNEMQFVIMTYVPEVVDSKTKHIGLVGKGITFDTGGLNIKTAGMLHMKCDMAGGGAVFGAMQLIADLKLPVKATAIVPCCENAVDAKSFLPSDVISSYSGHSIEIIDTDAEGRLILADGISYLIKNYKPDTVVDIATLTGSSVGTFGYECGALFTNNKSVCEKLQQTGDLIGERLWQLPLWDSYKSDIESDIADVKNYSGKPVAGAISAAKFLEFFTEEHTAWAHLDIAGVAFGDDEFAKSKHATAYGVHLLAKFIESF